jgi:hypothetical protein
MSGRLDNVRVTVLSRLLGYNPADAAKGLQESASRIEQRGIHSEALEQQILGRVSALEEELRSHVKAMSAHVREQRDDVPRLKAQLDGVRASPGYAAVLADREPLVTVRMAAWRKTEELMDVAIASVLKQTYERFEIVVVNDGPNETTRDAIAKLGDARIRYVEFPEQKTYPSDPHKKWMVAGSPGMNRGAELARGSWIAPLDDDDEFSPDHIEKLVGLALNEQAELAYGALLQKHLTHGTEHLIWSYPPAISQFSFMGAIYMKHLDFFRYDEQSWIVGEPGDWNLIRRMKAADVKMASTKDIVGTMYSVSYTHKDD